MQYVIAVIIAILSLANLTSCTMVVQADPFGESGVMAGGKEFWHTDQDKTTTLVNSGRINKNPNVPLRRGEHIQHPNYPFSPQNASIEEQMEQDKMEVEYKKQYQDVPDTEKY